MPIRDISSGPVVSLSRYDLVLAVIPTVFIVSILIGQLFDLPGRVTLGGASVLGALAVVDALFFNPPRSGGAEGAR